MEHVSKPPSAGSFLCNLGKVTHSLYIMVFLSVKMNISYKTYVIVLF